MPTGACGINCDTCRLNRDGVCSSCGAGTSEQGHLKFEAQERLLGAPCPLLACARINRIDYCPRDCDQFPCENFFGNRVDAYPYSQGYLAMQKRRREMVDQNSQAGDTLEIPEEHWREIANRSIDDIIRCSGGRLSGEGFLLLDVMNRTLRVDRDKKRIVIKQHGQWRRVLPLTGFVSAVYLAKCRAVPLSGRWISEKDLSSSHFFRGIHQLRTGPVLERYGHTPADFIESAQAFGGVETQDSGDAAVRLWVFPLIPVKLILWCGDSELEPALTVMFDASIELLLPGDGIWALVQMVCETLVEKRI